MSVLTAIRRNASRSVSLPGLKTIRVGGTGGTGYLGNWIDSNQPGNVYSSSGRRSSRSMYIPGTKINWDSLTGEILSCPASRACLNWKARNRPQAVPVTQEQNEQAEWMIVADAQMTRQLRRPNPAYDGDTFLNMIDFSLDVNGNAYVLVERNSIGQLIEMWWWPHNKVSIPYNQHDIISSYVLTNQMGMQFEVPIENLYHLKFGLDPDDWRYGMSPTAAEKRGVYSLQQSANYRANIYRNFGTVGVILSAKNADQPFDPAEIKQLWRDKTTGDNVGDALAIDVPIDANFPGVTPQSMAIETMDDRPEADICALRGLSATVVGLHVGRLSKTYANMKEAREAAWEECIMPGNQLIATQLGHRLVPEYAPKTSIAATEKYVAHNRIAFDYRGVRPLQPDRDKQTESEVNVFKAGITTVKEFCVATNRPMPDPAVEDKRFFDLFQIVGQQNSALTPPNSNVATPVAAGGKHIEPLIAQIEALSRDGHGG